MARIADLILIGIAVAGWAALLVYKLVLMRRYRDDPKKLEGLIWTDQVYPKRIHRWLIDEDYNSRMKSTKPQSARK
jgi:hypothetical protein